MAIRQYEAVAPANKLTVTKAVGASIGAASVRVTVDDALIIANGGQKAEVLRLLKVIEMRIIEDTWPLA